MTFFDPETIRIGCAVSRAVTDARTRRTKEALARGETPDLVGALTPADLLRWIENAERKKRESRGGRARRRAEGARVNHEKEDTP